LIFGLTGFYHCPEISKSEFMAMSFFGGPTFPVPVFPGSQIVSGPIIGAPPQSDAPVTVPAPPQVFTTLPAIVSVLPTSTAPSPVAVLSTGLPTPTNVQTDPTASTVLTSESLTGLALGELEAIITTPSQHIIGVLVLLAIGWFIWKHR
jgi:hypothetical protein